ncbi:hypothetical protein [Georgenia sp. SYP-B2076]|nr:hypothetical protein [Georgenia sp. SYP-B2076]
MVRKLGASLLLAVGLVGIVAAPSSAASVKDGRVSTNCSICWPMPGSR